MARSVESILRQQVGDMVFQLAITQSKLEQSEEEKESLKIEIEKLKQQISPAT